jgi:hypothetical protein
MDDVGGEQDAAGRQLLMQVLLELDAGYDDIYDGRLALNAWIEAIAGRRH